ncbi:hypothetical protein HOD08_04240 [bacterium]|nr:hypothetical protein [bacterium]
MNNVSDACFQCLVVLAKGKHRVYILSTGVCDNDAQWVRQTNDIAKFAAEDEFGDIHVKESCCYNDKVLIHHLHSGEVKIPDMYKDYPLGIFALKDFPTIHLFGHSWFTLIPKLRKSARYSIRNTDDFTTLLDSLYSLRTAPLIVHAEATGDPRDISVAQIFHEKSPYIPAHIFLGKLKESAIKLKNNVEKICGEDAEFLTNVETIISAADTLLAKFEYDRRPIRDAYKELIKNRYDDFMKKYYEEHRPTEEPTLGDLLALNDAAGTISAWNALMFFRHRAVPSWEKAEAPYTSCMTPFAYSVAGRIDKTGKQAHKTLVLASINDTFPLVCTLQRDFGFSCIASTEHKETPKSECGLTLKDMYYRAIPNEKVQLLIKKHLSEAMIKAIAKPLTTSSLSWLTDEKFFEDHRILRNLESFLELPFVDEVQIF